jgi:hypothetical protein
VSVGLCPSGESCRSGLRPTFEVRKYYEEFTERELGEARVLDRVGSLETGGAALDRALGEDYFLRSRGAKGAPSTRQGRAEMLRKSSAAAAVIAFATAGSALFGGVALASDGDTNTGGTGGTGGAATAYCVNSASSVPFLNTIDEGSAGDVTQTNDCDPVGGDGGKGGTGAVYK